MPNGSIFEPLENRTLFSVWTVTSLMDDGSAGTLRSVIAEAESTSGDQTIEFDPSLTASHSQTIALDGSALEITATSGTLTIQGPTGSNGITIDAQSESGAVAVDSGATVELDNLTLVNGSDGEGGGIENAGTLNVSNCTITVSSAEWYGGGINNWGTLGVDSSTISDITLGGGIDNFGTATIASSTITGNSGFSDGNDYGGGVTNFGTMTISDSSITNNTTDVSGGGIASWNGLLTVTDCTITGNTGNAGGLFIVGSANISGSTITGNTANITGGGIESVGATNITDSTIAGNTATGAADAVCSAGTDSITDSTIGGAVTASGTLTASGLNSVTGGTFSIEVINAGLLQLPSSTTIPTLTIDAGGKAEQTSTDTTFGSEVLTVGSLSIGAASDSTNGGVLDLGNGDMIARDTDTTQLYGLIAAGYDNGFWDGLPFAGPIPASIVSANAAADPNPYGLMALGYSQIGSSAGDLEATSFDGEPVSSGDAVVALTYYGDVNVDREVNSIDQGIFDTGLADSLSGWSNGDFDYSGTVDEEDYTLQSNAITFLGDSEDATTAPSGPTISLSRSSDTATKPASGSSNESGGAVTVSATQNGSAVPVPKWTVHVTKANGQQVAAGQFGYIESHSEAAGGTNTFTITVNSTTETGNYIVTVDGPNGQSQTMTLTVNNP